MTGRTRGVLGAIGVAALGLATLGVSAAEAGGPQDKACVAEVRAAGDWGKNLNPGRADFVSGTPGDDFIEVIRPGVVFCGLGGDDTVATNNGWFYGGDGVDTVTDNFGMFDGGNDTDVVIMNHGVFNGRAGRDVVHHNMGLFDGGPGPDAVQESNSGTCVDVESGC